MPSLPVILYKEARVQSRNELRGELCICREHHWLQWGSPHKYWGPAALPIATLRRAASEVLAREKLFPEPVGDGPC